MTAILGEGGFLGPGDVQWMTAGSGTSKQAKSILQQQNHYSFWFMQESL
jgi:redox-sensitive bicupin YhaK (pirin superfamily)